MKDAATAKAAEEERIKEEKARQEQLEKDQNLALKYVHFASSSE